jgi:hypothetical protein
MASASDAAGRRASARKSSEILLRAEAHSFINGLLTTWLIFLEAPVRAGAFLFPELLFCAVTIMSALPRRTLSEICPSRF